MKATLILIFVGVATAQFRSNVDFSRDGSDYYMSWLHAGRNAKWSWDGARNHCRGLGGAWDSISINTAKENSLVVDILTTDNIPYIWTGGRKFGNSWRWLSGPAQYVGWSNTGGNGVAQPDNREGGEECLSVLNNIFQDGVKWHDINCNSHLKPVICEKPSSNRG